MEEKILDKLKASSGFKQRIFRWAQGIGSQAVDDEINKRPLGLTYTAAKLIVFNKIRSEIGFDDCTAFGFGAAPLKKKTRDFFKSIGMFLINHYGMSETTGPQFVNGIDSDKPIDISAVGTTIPGTEAKITDQDVTGIGEICYRGRNRFMGYYKNEEETLKTIDSEGFIKSGDQGYLTKEGNLYITGRIKELIVTAGGENVAPVPIEEDIKNINKSISNIMIVGDDRKYLTAILTLKADEKGNLSPEVLDVCNKIGSKSKTVVEAMRDEKLRNYIQADFDKVNNKSVSRASVVRKWAIVAQDFSIEGGELTPTLKLKRKVAYQKYKSEIEEMYASEAKF